MSLMNESEEVSLSLWKPEAYIEKISTSSVDFSGALSFRFDPNQFESLISEILYFFENFNVKLGGFKYDISLDLHPPSGISKYFFCKGLNAVIIPDASVKVLESIFLAADCSLRDTFCEYLIRKFVYLLSQSTNPVLKESQFSYRSRQSATNFPVAVSLELLLNSSKFVVYVLLSKELVNELMCKGSSSSIEGAPKNDSRQLKAVERPVYLCFLMVPLKELEEYLKPDTVIDLELPVTSKGYLKTGDNSAVIGSLLNADGFWAFKPSSDQSFTMAHNVPGKALFFVELFTVSSEDFEGELKSGKIFLSKQRISPNVSIQVGSRKVATGKIYFYDQKLVLVID